MDRNQVVRVKPSIIRQRTKIVLPTNISIVVRPSNAKVLNLKDLKKKPTPPPLPSPPARQPVNKSTKAPLAAVARQKLIKDRRTTHKNKSPNIKYVNREITPESSARIAALHNRGKGKLLVIVGNGPSIMEADLGLLKQANNVEILTVNKPDSRIWPTNYWAFFDSSQFRRNEDLWNGYSGIIFNSTAIKRQKATSMQLKNRHGKGWSRDLMSGVHIGRSSVYASMQIGTWMNHDHIYVLGCDMNPNGVDGKLHFYGQNPDVDPEQRKQRFLKEAAFYDHAASVMTPDERSRFTFCSSYNEHSFVDKFNRLDHRKAVEHILSHAKQLDKS